MFNISQFSLVVALGALLLTGTSLQAMDEYAPMSDSELEAAINSRFSQSRPEPEPTAPQQQFLPTKTRALPVPTGHARLDKSIPHFTISMPMTFGSPDDFQHLTKLIISSPQISIEGVNQISLSKLCPKLETFILETNPKSLSINVDAYNLPTLTVLQIPYDFGDCSMYTCTQLKSLTAPFLTSSNDIKVLPQLEKLSMTSGKMITNSHLSNLTNLKELHLNPGFDSKIDNNGISNLTKLEILSGFYNCNLTQEGFVNLKNLKILSFRNYGSLTFEQIQGYCPNLQRF